MRSSAWLTWVTRRLGIERKHAGRNALENRFHLPAALIEFRVGGAQVAAGGLDLPAAAFQIFRHAVERAHQVADLVGGADIDAIIEASAGNFLRRLGKGRQRSCHDLREEQRQPRRHKQHHHREQQQQIPCKFGARPGARERDRNSVAGWLSTWRTVCENPRATGSRPESSLLREPDAQPSVYSVCCQLNCAGRPAAASGSGRRPFRTDHGAGALKLASALPSLQRQSEPSLQRQFMTLKFALRLRRTRARKSHARSPAMPRSPLLPRGRSACA